MLIGSVGKRGKINREKPKYTTKLTSKFFANKEQNSV